MQYLRTAAWPWRNNFLLTLPLTLTVSFIAIWLMSGSIFMFAVPSWLHLLFQFQIHFFQISFQIRSQLLTFFPFSSFFLPFILPFLPLRPGWWASAHSVATYGQRGSWDPFLASTSLGLFLPRYPEYNGTEGPPIYLVFILPHFFLLPNSFVPQQRGVVFLRCV